MKGDVMKKRLPEHVYWRRRLMVFGPVFLLLAQITSQFSTTEHEPAGSSRSWYVSWAQKPDAVEKAEGLGCEEGERANAGVVFLGYGRQRDGGPSGFRSGVVPYERIAEVTAAFAKGLERCSSGEWVLAAMTSNHKLDDVAMAGRFGTEWGELAKRSQQLFDGDRVEIAAGSDVEPAWGPYEAARAWSEGAHATGARLAYTPSADGCPTEGDRPCANAWGIGSLAYLMWGIDADAVVMPQVYRDVMARQWGRIAEAWESSGGEARFAGALSQRGACLVTGQKPCLSIGPKKSQALLSAALGREVPAGSDISW
jgi:hypothetical protein